VRWPPNSAADVVDPRDGDIDSYIREATGGHGVDVSFDAAGSVTFGTAVAALRSGGTSVILAHYADDVTLDANAVLSAEKRIVGSFAYRDEDFCEVIGRIAAGDLQPTRLITARIGLQHIVERGIEHLLSEGRDTEVKILVSPDHE
jgi:(R,R)-butanediol dehydrogenase/meso-butanediol dehydrogenase/diacetyl reductase